MPSKTWTKIGLCLLLLFIGFSLLYENNQGHEKLSAETNNTIQDGDNYWKITLFPPQETPKQEYMVIGDHKLEFVSNGKIVYVLDWKRGVVSGSGEIEPAARLLMQTLSEQIHNECKGQK